MSIQWLIRSMQSLLLVVGFLFFASSSAYAACGCDDGFTLGGASCCGGDGERLCNIAVVGNCDTACIAPAENVGVNCAVERQLGDRCSAFFPCAAGLDCEFEVFEPALRCRNPNFADSGAATPANGCLLLRSEGLADEIRSGNTFGAVSFGAGGSATGVGAASAEAGVVYGKNGDFGCYRTLCLGFSANPFPTGSVYAAFGGYTGWERFEGDSLVAAFSASVSIAGAGVEFTLGEVTDLTPMHIGNLFSVGVVGGGAPFPADVEGNVEALACNTEVIRAFTPPPPTVENPGPDQWMRTSYTGGNSNGHYDLPWSSLDAAFGPQSKLLDNTFPELFIEGAETAVAQGENTPETRADDVPRQTILTVSPTNGVGPGSAGAEFILDKRVTLHSTDGELTIEMIGVN